MHRTNSPCSSPQSSEYSFVADRPVSRIFTAATRSYYYMVNCHWPRRSKTAAKADTADTSFGLFVQGWHDGATAKSVSMPSLLCCCDFAWLWSGNSSGWGRNCTSFWQCCHSERDVTGYTAECTDMVTMHYLSTNALYQQPLQGESVAGKCTS